MPTAKHDTKTAADLSAIKSQIETIKEQQFPSDAQTILYGTVDPTVQGADGDFYINTTTHKLFGPKLTTWPAGVSIVGPQGGAGVNGTNSLLTAAAAPSDGALAASQLLFWLDPTNGAGKLMIKAKTANGTVVTGSVALT